MLQVGKCCGLAVDIVDLWRIVIAQFIRLSELEALFTWLSLSARPVPAGSVTGCPYLARSTRTLHAHGRAACDGNHRCESSSFHQINYQITKSLGRRRRARH
jgi:hypothetical protein